MMMNMNTMTMMVMLMAVVIVIVILTFPPLPIPTMHSNQLGHDDCDDGASITGDDNSGGDDGIYWGL